MSIEFYREEVREAILQRAGKPLLNGTADHAAIIVQEAFANAQKSIRLLTNRLDVDCYGRQGVRDAAKSFLAGNDRSMEVLIEGGLWDNGSSYDWSLHPFVADLAQFTKGDNVKLRLRRVPKNWAEAYSYNFLILDDYGYRFESDRNRPAAVAAFLPPDAEKAQIKNLSGIFEKIWDHSGDITLQ